MFGLASKTYADYNRQYEVRMEEAQERLMETRESLADATAMARQSARLLRRIKAQVAL